MSLVMPAWQQDVKGLWAAWRMRRRPAAMRRSGWRPAQFAMLAALLSMPLCAVEGGHAVYVSGTSTSVAPGTLGTLNARSAEALVFHASNGTGKDVTIPYAAVRSFRYSGEVARHLGGLAAIAVKRVRARGGRQGLSITYVDAAQIPQVALLEIPAHEARSWLTILRARAPQACGTWLAGCGGYVK